MRRDYACVHVDYFCIPLYTQSSFVVLVFNVGCYAP